MNDYLIKDLQSRLGTANLWRWIEEESERLSNYGLVAAGHVEFTRDLLQARNIRGIYESNTVGRACIEPAHDKYYDIYYRKGLPLTTLRFSIAHEIGHTFLFAPGGGARPLSPAQRKLGRDPSIEYLCNRFAQSILLPRQRVQVLLNDLIQRKDILIPLHLIRKVSASLQVAEQAVVRRIFFDREIKLDAVICLRHAVSEADPSGTTSPLKSSDRSDSWSISWCSIANGNKEFVSGYGIPFARRGRRIPTDMIPELPSEGTHAVSLDGRWWHGLKKLPTTLAKVPLKRLAKGYSKVGYASKDGKWLFLALPSQT